MDKVSIVLSAIAMAAMVLLIAPNVLAMNRGKVLRNIALWLIILLFLAFVYQNFGPKPGSPFDPLRGKSEKSFSIPEQKKEETKDNATGVQL